MCRLISRVSPVLKFIGLVCAICFPSAAFAQVRYHITRIPTAQGANSVALGINNKGQVVGYNFQGEDYQTFVYSSPDRRLTDVGSLGGKINAACAINESGQITGYSQDGNGNILAFLFSSNQPIASLGTLDGASTSEAFGINSSGAVVGDSQSGTQNHRPALFYKNAVQDLGLGSSNEPDALETAYAINDAGQIVGRRAAGHDAFHAFTYLNGQTTDLGTLGGANGEALALNKHGQIVGDSDTAEGATHAFVFDHSKLEDLGTLPGFDNASYARGINNAGDIVGESDSADQKRAFLFTRGQLVELDKLADNLLDAGFSALDVAYGINDNGLIVGYGTGSDNLTAAFVAVPEERSNHGSAPTVAQAQGGGENVSESNAENYNVFYSDLSSDEGNWVEAGNYGYCFRPRVSRDWRPYQDGHWVWTDRGWYWDSNERFGWATYHYGRWADISGTGWCWVPGNQWAPAWVSWRQSDEDVGWAPLPPEADYSGNGISSWSDSYYDIGPAAYAFISYSHWHEPSYARYIESPRRNLQIFSQTRNVTNIVTNNNVINNFGPPVQTVAAKTNQNIQQVKLAFSPATDPKTNFGQTLRGNELKLVAPAAILSPQGAHAPAVENRIGNPQVNRGWQGVQSQDAAKLRKTIAEQNPVPKDLPKPTPFANPNVVNKVQGTGAPSANGSSVAGQKAPPNLMKPGARSPNANITPGVSPSAAGTGKKSVPPNLLGAKPSGMPAVPPGPGETPVIPGSNQEKKPPGANVPEKSSITPKGIPPNLIAPRPSTISGQERSTQNQSPQGPAPASTVNLPRGQNAAHPAVTPRSAVTPATERKAGAPAAPIQQPGPQTPETAPPAKEAKPVQQAVHPPGATGVPEPHVEPVATPKPAATVKAKQVNKAPPAQVHHAATPQPQAQRAAAVQPQPHKAAAPKQEIKASPASVQHAAAPQPPIRHAPAAQPEPRKAAPAPPQKSSGQKPAPAKAKPTPAQ
jgi:probable HAF family extracellular repeat protein